MKGTPVSDSPPSPDNVIVVSFRDDSNAFDALTRLKELDSQQQLDLRAAAVVVRDHNGAIEEKDEVVDEEWEGTAGGGLIGLLIGIIGGPLGVLIGGATGVLVGSLFDVHDADKTESVLGEISRSVDVGRDSLIAEVSEPSPDVIDTAMERLGGSVLRRSVADVEAEIAAAERAQREARKKARKELRHARHEKHQEEVHAKVQELKAKLHPSRAATKSA
jgi:uncharacterized membrane protein